MLRLKMLHQPGNFWQGDNVCDTSDSIVDVDAKRCLQCDGTVCDTTFTNTNIVLEFVPKGLKEVWIRAVCSNMRLIVKNYTDTTNKQNTRMNA